MALSKTFVYFFLLTLYLTYLSFLEQNGCLQPNVSAKLALKVNLLNEANAKIQIAKEKFLHSEENAQLKTAKANLLKQENLRNLAIIKLEEADIEIKEAEKKIEKAILEIRLAEARVQESETKKAIGKPTFYFINSPLDGNH